MIATFDSFVTLKTDMKNRLRRGATMVSRYLSWVWGWFPVSVFVVKVRVFQWNRLSVFLLQMLLPRTTDDGQITDRLRLWYMTSSHSMPNKKFFFHSSFKMAQKFLRSLIRRRRSIPSFERHLCEKFLVGRIFSILTVIWVWYCSLLRESPFFFFFLGYFLSLSFRLSLISW